MNLNYGSKKFKKNFNLYGVVFFFRVFLLE